jgi:glutathione S-transferase
MAQFTVYGVIGSPYTRAVLLGLEEKGQAYEVIPLKLGAHRQAEHLGRQPFGRVPAVEHGDFKLYEAQAVLRYLDRLYPEPALTPEDPRQAARMDQIMGIADWYLMPHLSGPVVFQRVVAPRFGLPCDEARLQEALPKAKVCIDELGRLMGDQPFMASDSLSLADLMVAPQLSMAAQCLEGQALLAPHANLKAWIERMEQRPSLIARTWERLAQTVQAA